MIAVPCATRIGLRGSEQDTCARPLLPLRSSNARTILDFEAFFRGNALDFFSLDLDRPHVVRLEAKFSSLERLHLSCEAVAPEEGLPAGQAKKSRRTPAPVFFAATSRLYLLEW